MPLSWVMDVLLEGSLLALLLDALRILVERSGLFFEVKFWSEHVSEFSLLTDKPLREVHVRSRTCFVVLHDT